jgi:(S)-ureidoglycine aminohydrolase
MQTRTVIKPRHALIAPDGHVPSAFPGWSGLTAHVIISPAMGAGFSQLLLVFEQADGTAVFPADAKEHVIYVETGSVRAEWDGGILELGAGGFLFTPPDAGLEVKGSPGTRVTVYRKFYQQLPGLPVPAAVHGNAMDIPDEPFLGNERARLRTLLPIDPAFDIAMNIFTYQPGATLPFVETHIMEHGLLMLEGQGVYRLEDCYYPVEAGDAIWMAPYCPQWFAAIGDVPASYLYHKDIHRIP